MDRHITAPINKETARSLHAGDYVYITGTMYTARDAAHKRMYEILQKGGELPVDWKDQVIYYMGHPRQERADRSDQQVRQQQAEWINTHRSCWILDWEQWLEKAKEARLLSMRS